MNTTPETQFMHSCAQHTNKLHREASAEYIRLLTSFMALGWILLMLTLVLIGLKWEPGHSQDAVKGFSGSRQNRFEAKTMSGQGARP